METQEQELTCNIYDIGNYHTAICVGSDEESMIIAITQEQALDSKNLKAIYGVTIRSIEENYGSVWVSCLGGLRASRPIKDYMSYEAKTS